MSLLWYLFRIDSWRHIRMITDMVELERYAGLLVVSTFLPQEKLTVFSPATHGGMLIAI